MTLEYKVVYFVFLELENSKYLGEGGGEPGKQWRETQQGGGDSENELCLVRIWPWAH